MPKISLSFKENDRDMKLYADVMSQSSKSEFIKNAISFYLQYKHLGPILDQISVKIEQNCVKIDKK